MIANDSIRCLLNDKDLLRVLTAIDVEGAETRIVGGAVRNALLGVAIKDIDCATTALPHDVIRLASAAGLKAVPTGIDHGTVTVISEGRPFEITTLRRDVNTDGRRAEVSFGTDFSADAHRRDFTINALYVDKHGKIYDFTGGLADIAAQRIRFIGDALTRIREDYLRILRFFRFSADYGKGKLDSDALAACIRERNGLPRLSRERIGAEFLRILTAQHAVDVVVSLSDTGLLGIISGGIAQLERFTRTCEKSQDAVLRLAALGIMVQEDADRLRERLRLSNSAYARLEEISRLIVKLSSRRKPLDIRALRQLVVSYGITLVSDVLTFLHTQERPLAQKEALALLARYVEREEEIPCFPLTGRYFIELGVPAGPEVGRALERARKLWFEKDCPFDQLTLSVILKQATTQF